MCYCKYKNSQKKLPVKSLFQSLSFYIICIFTRYQNIDLFMSRMKIIIVSLVVMISGSGVIAQNESFLGLCLGAAIPQGVYAEKDFYTEGAGYANTGFLFTFDGALFPDEYLGFGATVTYGSNNPDKEQYKEDLINDITERYPDLEEIAADIYFDYGTWRYLNIHVGPAFTVNAGSFNFDLKALAGLSLAWTPQLLVQAEWDEDNSFSRKVSDKAIPTIGYTVGAGVRYSFKGGYVVRFITEFTNCKPTMEVTEDVLTSIAEGSEITTTEVKMPIKNIHVGIGIAYNFEI